MRKIIYTRPDGGISVVHPIINTHPPENITEAEAEQRAWDKLPADAINPRFVDASEIPADRANRKRWRDTGVAIVVDPTPDAEVATQQIAAIESAQPITQRAIREMMLAIGQAYPQAQATVFYKKAAAQEAEIVPLRAKL